MSSNTVVLVIDGSKLLIFRASTLERPAPCEATLPTTNSVILGGFYHFQANIDILEANKSSNKEEIRRLRLENKDVRLKLSQLVKGGTHGDEVRSFAADDMALRTRVHCCRCGEMRNSPHSIPREHALGVGN